MDFISVKDAERCIEELNEFEFQSRKLQVRLGSRKSDEDKEGIIMILLR